MAESDASRKLITEFYSLHLEEIQAYVAKRMDYSADSEDLVQNIFLRLLESGKIISAITLPCLVYTIARNMVSDYWRHKVSVGEYEHYVKTSSARDDMLVSGSVYSVFEFTEVLERGMARLADNQRKVYRLNVIGGMKVSEISEYLNENYKSVENRLGAARKIMRGYMRRMMA